MCACAGAVLTCALLVENTGNVRLTGFQLLSGAVNCTSVNPLAMLAPGQSAICIVETPVVDPDVVDFGGVVAVDYSGYTVSAEGSVSVVAANTPLSGSVKLSGVVGWTAPVYYAALDATIDPATCTVPTKAGMDTTPLSRHINVWSLQAMLLGCSLQATMLVLLWLEAWVMLNMFVSAAQARSCLVSFPSTTLAQWTFRDCMPTILLVLACPSLLLGSLPTAQSH
jgi:hypothetical protein